MCLGPRAQASATDSATQPPFTSVSIDFPVYCPPLGSLPLANEQIIGHQAPSITPLLVMFACGIIDLGKKEHQVDAFRLDFSDAPPPSELGEICLGNFSLSGHGFSNMFRATDGIGSKLLFLFFFSPLEIQVYFKLRPEIVLLGCGMQHGRSPEGRIIGHVTRFLFTANLTLKVTGWTCCMTACVVFCICFGLCWENGVNFHPDVLS